MPIDSISYFNLKRSTASESGPWTIIQVLNQQTVTATNSFTVPAKGSDVTVLVVDAAWIEVNEYVNVALAGLFKVMDKIGNQLALRYLNETYNTRSGNVIPVGSQVLPGSYEDSFVPSPKVWYLLEGITANGITITYNVVSVEGASQAGSLLWVQTWGHTTLQDTAYSCAADSSGNVFVGGSLFTTLNLRRFSSGGALTWNHVDSASGTAFGACVDSSGNCYFTGNFQSAILFPGLPIIWGNGAFDCIFVVKVSPAGTFLWARSFPAEAAASSFGYGIALSGSSVWVTGKAEGSINFGGGALTQISPSHVFLVKLNSSDGTYGGFSRYYAGETSGNTTAGRSVAVDGSGNVYVTGLFTDKINFGGVDMTTPASGGTNGFLVKLNSAGVFQWQKNHSDNDPNQAQQFSDATWSCAVGPGDTVDPGGVVYAGGQFKGDIDFGNGVVLNGSKVAGNTHDGFLVKYNSSGTARWAKKIAGAAGVVDSVQGVAVDLLGNVAIAGKVSGANDFGGGSVPANFNDGYTAKYASDGTFKWVKVFGGFSGDAAMGVAVDSGGNVFSCGTWYGNVDFGDGVIRSTPTGGSSEAFAAKYSA